MIHKINHVPSGQNHYTRCTWVYNVKYMELLPCNPFSKSFHYACVLKQCSENLAFYPKMGGMYSGLIHIF